MADSDSQRRAAAGRSPRSWRWSQAAELLGPVTEAIGIPVLVLDRAGRVRWVSDAFDHEGTETRAAGWPVGEPLEALLSPAIAAQLEPWLVGGARDSDVARSLRLELRRPADGGTVGSAFPWMPDGVHEGWIVALGAGAGELRRAAHLGHAVEREKRHREKLEALLNVSRAVTSSLDHQTVLSTIAREVRRVIQVDECTVFLLDESEHLLKPVACDVVAWEEEMLAVRLRVGEGITGNVALTGRGEIVPDTNADERAAHVPGTPSEESSLLCVPLSVRERVIGVITLARLGDDRRPFEQEDLEVVTLFAAEASAAIQNARMFARTKAAYDELSATQQQLVQSAKLNALGEMAGGVAHDFNNVLAAILGRTQLLLRSTDDGALRRQLEVIEQAALDGAHTVRRVQEFTRVRHDEHFEPLDLNEVVQGVVELTRPAWQTNTKKRGVTVDLHLDLRTRHAVSGNASELREVFSNLLLNAVDAMPWGGDLFIVTEDAGGTVRVGFRDTGVGMDEPTRLRVFDPFFTTKQVQGTGLGLSVAYGIVTRHHGLIEVESERGAGTEFVVTLPGCGTARSPLSAHEPFGPYPARRILAIDDEEPVLDVLADMLRTLGHDVHVAVGGEAGVGAFRRLRPDIVFTDLGMPEVNGWDVALKVRADHPLTPIVLVSGWGYQLDEETVTSRGVDLVLTKPFTIDDVERTLARVGDRIERPSRRVAPRGPGHRRPRKAPSSRMTRARAGEHPARARRVPPVGISARSDGPRRAPAGRARGPRAR